MNTSTRLNTIFRDLGIIIDSSYNELSQKIYDLFTNGKIDYSCTDAKYLNMIGSYYFFIKKYDQTKKYYIMAILKGDSNAMNNMACYLQNIEKNYKLAKKYYIMAINKGNAVALYNIAKYYLGVEKNYELAKKYFIIVLNFCHPDEIISDINALLNNSFDPVFAVKSYDILNDRNLNKVNTFVIDYLKN